MNRKSSRLTGSNRAKLFLRSAGIGGPIPLLAVALEDSMQHDTYESGVAAAIEGRHADSCPFPTGPDRKEWLAGFFSVKQPQSVSREKLSGDRPSQSRHDL